MISRSPSIPSSSLTRAATLVAVVIGIAVLAACQSAPPAAASAMIQVKDIDVEQAHQNSDFSVLAPSSQSPLAVGDRVRTSPRGQALLRLPCALVLIYGGSNLQAQELSANGANLHVSGAQLYSSKCSNLQVSNGEATIQSVGTVFFVGYDPTKHKTLVWTQKGAVKVTTAQAASSQPQTVEVSAGDFSVVDQGQAPEPARPVAEMQPAVDDLGLAPAYDQVVQTIEGQGFGPDAETPMPIETIVEEPATPESPTEVDTPPADESPTEAATPSDLVPTETDTPSAGEQPTETDTPEVQEQPTETDTPEPPDYQLYATDTPEAVPTYEPVDTPVP